MSRLAYIDPDGRLVTCAPDGRDAHIWGAAGGRAYQFPAWSPTAPTIAAVGADRRGAGVYLLTADPADPGRPLYVSPPERRASPFYLYWSPDGRQVAFIAAHSADGIGLHVVEPQSSAAHLVATGQPLFWQWLANSAELLLHVGNGADSRLLLVEAQPPVTAVDLGPSGFFQTPGVSPSGRYLACSERLENGDCELVVTDRLAGQARRLPHLGAVALAWNPRRDLLAFTLPERDENHFFGPLYLWQPERNPRRIVHDAPVAFFWSPDGRHLACLHAAAEPGGSGLRWAGEMRFRNGHAPPAMERSPVDAERLWLELWIVDTVYRSRWRLAVFRPTPIFLHQFLPFFDQYALSHRIWSPNGAALVLPVWENGGSRVMVWPIHGDPPQPIGVGDMPSWSCV